MCEITDKLRSYDATSGYSTTMRKAADKIDLMAEVLVELRRSLGSAYSASEEGRKYLSKIDKALNT